MFMLQALPMALSTSGAPGSKAIVAPCANAASRLAGSGSMATMRAGEVAEYSATAVMPTPPQPMMAT